MKVVRLEEKRESFGAVSLVVRSQPTTSKKFDIPTGKMCCQMGV